MHKPASKAFPRIESSQYTQISNWVTLVENRVVQSAQDDVAYYHSFVTADYVSILAIANDGRIPLVRQFRPALNSVTLEFPGGMRDGDEEPRACAIRELAEEVGLEAASIEPLADFFPELGPARQSHVDLLHAERRAGSRLAAGIRCRLPDGERP